MRRPAALAPCLAPLALCLALAASAAPAAPARVVSINLCTDQLALLLAAPGQLVSVSHVAADPDSSALAGATAGLHLNHGSAEEVFLLAPDLVLASTWTPPATVAMLERLGLRVARIAPASDIAGTRAAIAEMGRLLGREAAAAAALAALDARLAAVTPAGGRLAALVAPNGFSSGRGSLADAILRAAGLRNLAAERGIAGVGRLPLEVVVMAGPDLVVTEGGGRGPALAREGLAHPALAWLRAAAVAVAADARWICGTPLLADVVAELAAAAGGG